MEEYKNDMTRRYLSNIVRVDLQHLTYKGSFNVMVCGNIFGMNVLKSVEMDELTDGDVLTSDCNLVIHEGDEEGLFSVTLKTEKGEELLIQKEELHELNSLVVGISIIEAFEKA